MPLGPKPDSEHFLAEKQHFSALFARKTVPSRALVSTVSVCFDSGYGQICGQKRTPDKADFTLPTGVVFMAFFVCRMVTLSGGKVKWFFYIPGYFPPGQNWDRRKQRREIVKEKIIEF